MKDKIKTAVSFMIPILGVLLFLWLWIFGNQGLYELESLHRLKKNLLQEQKELQQEKQELEAELQRLEDPLYLKHLIHQEMGFIEKGEVMIKFSKISKIPP